MSELQYMYNREEHMTTRALFHTYEKSLPMLFVVCNGYIYQEDIDFPSGQALLIFSIGYQERALVHDANGRTLSIPVDYRHRFNVLSHNKDKDLKLRQVVDKYKFPVCVEISKPETVYFSDNSAASFKSLKVMGIHIHPYLKAVTVNEGALSACVFPVPLYLKGVTFCRVKGLDSGNKAEDSTRALQTHMAQLTAQLQQRNFPKYCGDKEIIMLSDNLIIDMNHFYDKVTENVYIRIGLKNSNEPKYKHMIPHRRLPPIPAGELEEEVPKRPPKPLKQKTAIERRELPPIPCQKLSPHQKESAVRSLPVGEMTSEEKCRRVNEVSMSSSLHLSGENCEKPKTEVSMSSSLYLLGENCEKPKTEVSMSSSLHLSGENREKPKTEVSMSSSLYLLGENREKPKTEDTFYEIPPADYDVEILPADLSRIFSDFFQGHSTSDRFHRDNSQTDLRGRDAVSQKQGKLQDLSREGIGTVQGSEAVTSSNPSASLPSDTVFLKEKMKSDTFSSRQSNIASSKSTNQNEKEMARVKPMPPKLITRHSSPALIPSYPKPIPSLIKMTVGDVGELLNRLFLEKHEQNFRDNLVDGVILSKITDEILHKEFGFSELETLRLRTFIESGHIPK